MLFKLGISSSSVEVSSVFVFGNAQGDGTISASSSPLLVLRFCLFLVLPFRFFDVLISSLVTVQMNHCIPLLPEINGLVY